jgi:molybdopterin converting factor subunit 1
LTEMTITTLLFASYADYLGVDRVEVHLPTGATIRELLAVVTALPGGDRLPPEPLVAINMEYAAMERRLADGDEVAVIPPVAGG